MPQADGTGTPLSTSIDSLVVEDPDYQTLNIGPVVAAAGAQLGTGTSVSRDLRRPSNGLL